MSASMKTFLTAGEPARAALLRLLTMLAVLGSASGYAAQNCAPGYPATTPSGDFADAGNGTVLHLKTGLLWKRCAEGQSWSGGACQGVAVWFDWPQALARAALVNAGSAGGNAGWHDWRLPNINELRSIVERACLSPAINVAEFPTPVGTSEPDSNYWSSSPYRDVVAKVWSVTFHRGYEYWYTPNLAGQVRLVRGGPAGAAFDATAQVPGAPVIQRVVPNRTSLRIFFAAPGSDGGVAVSGFTATCTGAGGSYQGSGLQSPVTVSGLTPGASYVCSVHATNSIGSGPESMTATKVARANVLVPLLMIVED